MDMALKDNSQVKDPGLAEHCRGLQDLIKQGKYFLVDLLDQSGQRKDEHPEIFREGPGSKLWAGNYVGVFEYSRDDRTTRVTIGSRFDPENGESFFLRAMLEACWDIPLLFLEEYRGNRADVPYDLLLAVRLAMQLEQAWKQGVLRIYRSTPMYDSRVHGRLDLPRQIREGNGLSDGRTAHVTREYSGDNEYTHLFLKALLEAEKRHPDLMRKLQRERPRFRLARRDLLQQATGLKHTDKRSLLAHTKKRIVNPVYREYEALRVISRAFLRRAEGYQSQEEESTPFVTGVFLDISQLWERYLIDKVFKQVSPEDSPWYYSQQERKILNECLTIRPDFWWKDRGIVLDAKYRTVWTRAAGGSPWPEEVRENVYQVLSYMLALDCWQGGVIFPASGQHREPRPYSIPSRGGQRQFWCADFTIPSEETCYEKFLDGMEQEAAQLAGDLKNRIFNPPKQG